MDLPVLHGMGWSQKYLRVRLGSCDSGLWWLGQASPAVETRWGEWSSSQTLEKSILPAEVELRPR